jgi:hypothetical protein
LTIKIGGVDKEFSLAPKVSVSGAVEALGRALTIRAISHGSGVAVLGNTCRAVLAVIGEGPWAQWPRAIDVIIRGIAIGVVSNCAATDRACCMGVARAARWIDHIRIGGTELGVIDDVISIIIVEALIIAAAVLIIRSDQTIERIVSIGPASAIVIGGRGGGDHALGIAGIA